MFTVDHFLNCRHRHVMHEPGVSRDKGVHKSHWSGSNCSVIGQNERIISNSMAKTFGFEWSAKGRNWTERPTFGGPVSSF